MSYLNRVEMIVKVYTTPDYVRLTDDLSYCFFKVVEEIIHRPPEGGYTDYVHSYNIVAWNETADSCYQFLAIGYSIYLDGHLVVRGVTEDTRTHAITEIVIQRIIIFALSEEQMAYGYLPEPDDSGPDFYVPPTYPDPTTCVRLGIDPQAPQGVG